MSNLQVQLADLTPAYAISPSLAWTQPFDWLGTTAQENTQIGWTPFGSSMSWQLGPNDVKDDHVESGTGIL